MNKQDPLVNPAELEQRWPELKLDATAWLASLRLTPGDHRLAHISDLYLAHACLTGEEPAALRFIEHILRPAVAQLKDPRLTRTLLDDLLSELRDLTLPPPTGKAGRLATYSGGGSLKGWASVCAHRLAQHALRAQSRQSAELQPTEFLPGNPELDVMRQRYGELFRVALREALAALDAKERLVLTMYYGQGVTMDKLAEVYGVHRTNISRLIDRTHERIAGLVTAHVQRVIGGSDSEVQSLLKALRSQLESSVARWLVTQSGS